MLDVILVIWATVATALAYHYWSEMKYLELTVDRFLRGELKRMEDSTPNEQQ